MYSNLLYAFGGDGFPSGRSGLYANYDGPTTRFGFQYSQLNDAETADVMGRWQSHASSESSRFNEAQQISNDRLAFTSGTTLSLPYQPYYLRGVRAGRYEITFSARSMPASIRLWVGGIDQDAATMVTFTNSGGKVYPTSVSNIADGGFATSVSGTTTSANAPSVSSGDVLWVRAYHDGTTFSVKEIVNNAGVPTEGDWSSAGVCYSSPNISSAGGMIGFSGGVSVSIDDLTVKADRDGNGSYETTDHVERFTLDGSGYAPQGPEYDPAGNMTFDGEYQFTYDAWNRLVKVAKAYKEGTDNSGDVSLGSLQTGSVVSEAEFDGLGRRIVKQVKNSAWLDCTYHYYYNPSGHSVVEERNGSDQLIRELVWGKMYIDELVQIAMNDDPTDGAEQNTETYYWACQDTNYNVLGVIDSTGVLVERYEYTPYGERTVYFSAGTNDPDCYAPTQMSRRWKTVGGGTTVSGSSAQAWGLCPSGHQGLMHDAESGFIYNRARMLHPRLGRFMQHESLGYAFGANLYQSRMSRPTRVVDPTGRDPLHDGFNGTFSPPIDPPLPRTQDANGNTWVMGMDGQWHHDSFYFDPDGPQPSWTGSLSVGPDGSVEGLSAEVNDPCCEKFNFIVETKWMYGSVWNSLWHDRDWTLDDGSWPRGSTPVKNWPYFDDVGALPGTPLPFSDVPNPKGKAVLMYKIHLVCEKGQSAGQVYRTYFYVIEFGLFGSNPAITGQNPTPGEPLHVW